MKKTTLSNTHTPAHLDTLYLSGFSGVSGNMMIGALLDAGLPEEAFRRMVSALPVSGYQLKVEKVMKRGISATHFDVELDHSEQHTHRQLADIIKIIEAAELSAAVKARSIAVFTRLAEAEAKVHGTTVEKIHFHEVGAVDAIIDIVGTVFGLAALGIEKVYAGNLRTGFGVIQCAHGSMPIPAPATAELLNGIPYTFGDIEKELLTPTGAALLAVLCDGFGDRPDGFVSEKTAYGAGGRELDIPNVLRAEVGRVRRTRRGQLGDLSLPEKLLVLETNIDDCNPQIFDYVMERLFKAGALDVWLTPIQMKKNRPAVMLSVLAPAMIQGAVEQILFSETTTIGIRHYPVQRTAADRREETVATPWGLVRVKISSINGKTISATPEYDDCRKLAEASGVPLKEIIALAGNQNVDF
ncbi:MAG TPA: nickel pincer cofactor biosynthesis protein LarC [Pontiellaceae bacterium]|nr:nickel pincer cofactor biosynthesis protein LarC [Pontiellaceae bacterium]